MGAGVRVKHRVVFAALDRHPQRVGEQDRIGRNTVSQDPPFPLMLGQRQVAFVENIGRSYSQHGIGVIAHEQHTPCMRIGHQQHTIGLYGAGHMDRRPVVLMFGWW